MDKEKKFNLRFPILIYILKIWILTNIISAISIQIINVFQNDTMFWSGFLDILVLGLSFSFPSMLILAAIINSYKIKKIILVIISILLVFSTFYFVGLINLKHIDTLLYPTIYSLAISCLILIIKK